MKVESDILKTWESLKEHGDFSAIQEKYNVNRDAVALAFTSGECSSEIYIAINNFYGDKRLAIEASKQKITPSA